MHQFVILAKARIQVLKSCWNTSQEPDILSNITASTIVYTLIPMTQRLLIATYIMTNKRNGTLYIGVTSDLIRRVYEHKNGTIDGFTKRYDLHVLVYFEMFERIEDAIQREKHLKSWRRSWKLRLIEDRNPHWHDLWEEVVSGS